MIKKFHESARHAIRGVGFVWEGERNFRIESVVAFFILIISVLFRFSYGEICIILISVAAVLTGEMLNTIVEDLLDAVIPGHAEHVGRIKDITAGAVLFLSTFAAIAGVLTVAHHFLGIA
jgi:diacylglycerol kinase